VSRSRDQCIESQDEIDTAEQELEQGKSRSSKLDREGSLAVFQGLVGGVTSVPTTNMLHCMMNPACGTSPHCRHDDRLCANETIGCEESLSISSSNTSYSLLVSKHYSTCEPKASSSEIAPSLIRGEIFAGVSRAHYAIIAYLQ
jgi:hypothetical protein